MLWTSLALLGFEDFQSVYSIRVSCNAFGFGRGCKESCCALPCFAIAQNHCSIAKVEPGLLGTLRYHHSGSYLVSIWLPQDLAGPAPKDFFKEVSDCVSKATPEEIKERGTARLFLHGHRLGGGPALHTARSCGFSSGRILSRFLLPVPTEQIVQAH